MKTKACIFTIILSVGLANGRAQDTWTQKADFGGAERAEAVGFSIVGKGYIGTGNGTVDFWEYDPSTNAWTQKADFGGGGRWGATGFSIGNKGYIGTGQDDTFRIVRDFWEYDPAANTWTHKANVPGPGRDEAVGFSIGEKGYVGSGQHGHSGLDDFWEYDPATNAWTQKANFGGGSGATGFSIGNKGYMAAGQYFWEYDPATNAWTQKANFGGTGYVYRTGFSIGSRGYIGTGYDGGYTNEFWEYDPSTDSWTQKANFGGTGRQNAVGFSIAGKGYIGTGFSYDGNFNFYKDFWEYTPEGNANSYRDVILADNPIMYWRLGETSGTIAYDESANHRDATSIHQPLLGFPGAIANDTNTSVGFNGCNQWAGWIPTSSYSGAFTVEAWVKEKQIRPVETFFDTRTKRAEFSFDFKLDTLAGKEIHFDVGDGTQWLSNSGVPFDFKRNVWYYVAAVVTTTGATYYVDGSALGSVTYSGTPLLFDATHQVQIGTNNRYDSEWFDGAIDEVAVYNYALTADQIAAHYATGTGNCGIL